MQLYSWLKEFRPGKTFITPISQIITPGNEIGALINANEVEQHTILVRLIVFDQDYIINGEYLDKESNLADNYANISIYKVKDIMHKEIQFSETVRGYNQIQFANTVCKLTFLEGTELHINKNDFPNQQNDFMKTISSLAEL